MLIPYYLSLKIQYNTPSQSNLYERFFWADMILSESWFNQPDAFKRKIFFSNFASNKNCLRHLVYNVSLI